MTWLPRTAPGATAFDRVLGLRPELQADLSAFTDLLWTRAGVDPTLLELCRLRIAQIHGFEGQQPQARLAQDKIAALGDWRASASFSAIERACLDLAEKFVLDPRGVSDADVGALAEHLTPAQTVALIEAFAIFDGFGRFRAILAVDAD